MADRVRQLVQVDVHEDTECAVVVAGRKDRIARSPVVRERSDFDRNLHVEGLGVHADEFLRELETLLVRPRELSNTEIGREALLCCAKPVPRNLDAEDGGGSPSRRAASSGGSSPRPWPSPSMITKPRTRQRTFSPSTETSISSGIGTGFAPGGNRSMAVSSASTFTEYAVSGRVSERRHDAKRTQRQARREAYEYVGSISVCGSSLHQFLRRESRRRIAVVVHERRPEHALTDALPRVRWGRAACGWDRENRGPFAVIWIFGERRRSFSIVVDSCEGYLTVRETAAARRRAAFPRTCEMRRVARRGGVVAPLADPKIDERVVEARLLTRRQVAAAASRPRRCS